jgi:hypothetical protein
MQTGLLSLGKSNMTEPIEEAYFNWLCAKVTSPYINNYNDLLRILHTTEFVWTISGDRNRLQDGLELRDYFINESGYEKDPLWYNELCSVLEVLIAFAQRANFQTDIPVNDWFWKFMENLRLSEYRQQVSDLDRLEIDEILHCFVWRMYDENGYGSLFPMDGPHQDLRQIEIWYQFCAWVEEKELI